MRSELQPQAVIRIKGDAVVICAWCPDKIEADQLAANRGLIATHGICRSCCSAIATEVIFEAGERCAAPDSARNPQSAERGTVSGVPSCLVVFSCRMGGASK